MEEPLQHQTTTQCIGLPPTFAKGHRVNGPKAHHALTFKLDHSSGAAQVFKSICIQDAIRPFLEIENRSKNELSTNAYYNIKNEQHH